MTTACPNRETPMEKCADLNQRRRALLSYSRARGNPAPDKKNQLHSSVNCVRALELIKPTVFKVAIKNKYEISATDRYPSVNYSYKPPLDSSQLNLGKVTAWGNTTSISASLKNQTTQSSPTTTETQRYPFRSTNPKVKIPDESRTLCITAYGTKCDLVKRTSSRASTCRSPTFIKNESQIRGINIENLDDELEKLIQQILDEQNLTREDNIITNHDAEDHLSRKEEILVETPCETAASSGSLDSEFQQTEVNVRETLHFYLPTHDIQEEEEFTTAWEPPEEDVSQNSEVSNGNLKRNQKYKNTKKKQDDKKDSRIKDSAWASRPGSGFKDQMQRRPTCARKSFPAAAITGLFIEQKKHSETLEGPQNSLNQTQLLKHNCINRPVVDLTIYDLEAELDNAHRPQENAHINNSQSNTNENPTLVTDTENDKEKTKTFGFSTCRPKDSVVNGNYQANFFGRPQNIQQKQCISRVQMARYKPPRAKQSRLPTKKADHWLV